MTNHELEQAIKRYMTEAGTPLSEFDPAFIVQMIGAMAVSFHKYGYVAQAYPEKFDALSDIRTRLMKYRETGNAHFLVDAANFCMIEAMHPKHEKAHWGENDVYDSPGRMSNEERQLVQRDNNGNRIDRR